MGRALHHYQMISDGDRIVVGVSGGADSLTLMSILMERLARIPIRYELFAVYIDPGFEGSFAEPLETYCEKVGFPLRVRKFWKKIWVCPTFYTRCFGSDFV